MNYKIGDIVEIYEGTKERPVLIVNDGLGIDIDFSVARITSKKPRNKFDIPLEKWQEAGLHLPSTVRCSKLSTITPGKRMLKLGKIHEEDLLKGISVNSESRKSTVVSTRR